MLCTEAWPRAVAATSSALSGNWPVTGTAGALVAATRSRETEAESAALDVAPGAAEAALKKARMAVTAAAESLYCILMVGCGVSLT